MIRSMVVVLLATSSGAAGAMELGLRTGYSLPLDENFGARPELLISGEWNPWAGLRLRPGLRLAGPITLHGVSMGYPERASLGSFVQVSACFNLLLGWDLGALRIAVGPGFSHHVRLTGTAADAGGLEIVRGEPGYGHLDRLDFTDHAGVDALLEVSYAVTDHLRLSLGASVHHASVRLLAVPQEDEELTIGFWRYMEAFNAQLGVTWRFGD